MRFILSFSLLFIYMLGVSLTDPTKSFSPSVKIKIVHTHDVVKGHIHHHDFENDGGHDVGYESDHNHNQHSEHKHSTPHSHEVSVSMVSGYVLNTGAVLSLSMNVRDAIVPVKVYNAIPPKEVALNSIFRPPIG